MSDVLADIVRHKRAEVADLTPATGAGPSVRDFAATLRGRSRAVIAEIKRRSPAAGPLNENCDVTAVAACYARGGAVALSVLTDQAYFGGHIDDLAAVRQATMLPVLRKDFIIDQRQIAEARARGADACLLIVGTVDDDALAKLKHDIEQLRMTAIVEVHTAEELRRAVRLAPDVMLINQRNLHDLSIDRSTVARLVEACPDEVLLIAASGMRDAADVAGLPARVNGVLIGTSLMRNSDPTALLRSMTTAGCAEGVS